MKIVQVESIPETVYKKDNRQPIYDILNDFVSSDMKYAEIVLEDGDYCRPETARNTLWLACKRYKLNVNIITRNGKLYLSKRGI